MTISQGAIPEAATVPTTVRLWDVAHARAGDKGNSSILLVRPFYEEHYQALVTALTPQRIAEHFQARLSDVVIRPVAALATITVVLRNQLDGGVTRSARLDPHGKTLSGHLLDLFIPWTEAQRILLQP